MKIIQTGYDTMSHREEAKPEPGSWREGRNTHVHNMAAIRREKEEK